MVQCSWRGPNSGHLACDQYFTPELQERGIIFVCFGIILQGDEGKPSGGINREFAWQLRLARIKVGRNLLSIELVNLIHFAREVHDTDAQGDENLYWELHLEDIASRQRCLLVANFDKFAEKTSPALAQYARNRPILLRKKEDIFLDTAIKMNEITDSRARRFLPTLILESLNFHANTQFVPPGGLTSSPYETIPKQRRIIPHSCSSRVEHWLQANCLGFGSSRNIDIH